MSSISCGVPVGRVVKAVGVRMVIKVRAVSSASTGRKSTFLNAFFNQLADQILIYMALDLNVLLAFKGELLDFKNEFRIEFFAIQQKFQVVAHHHSQAFDGRQRLADDLARLSSQVEKLIFDGPKQNFILGLEIIVQTGFAHPGRFGYLAHAGFSKALSSGKGSPRHRKSGGGGGSVLHL